MARAQQSTTRNRRPPTIGNPPDRINIAYSLEATGTLGLRLRFAQEQAPLVMNGTCDYLLNGDPVAWQNINLTTEFLDISSPVELPEQIALTVPPTSIFIRSNTGGKIDAGTQFIEQPLIFLPTFSRGTSTEIYMSSDHPGPAMGCQWSEGAGWNGPPLIFGPVDLTILGVRQIAPGIIAITTPGDTIDIAEVTLPTVGMFFDAQGRLCADGVTNIS